MMEGVVAVLGMVWGAWRRGVAGCGGLRQISMLSWNIEWP